MVRLGDFVEPRYYGQQDDEAEHGPVIRAGPDIGEKWGHCYQSRFVADPELESFIKSLLTLAHQAPWPFLSLLPFR